MRRRRRWYRLKLVPVITLALVLGIFWLVEHNLRSTITAFAEAQAYWTANEAVHHAVLEKVVTETSYRDLIYVDKDAQGKVTLMQANWPKVNQVASQAALAIQTTLEDLPKKDLRFPVGQVFGSKLFAAYGPAIKLVLVPAGTVQVRAYDDFESAGINQTRHRIYLKIDSRVSVIVPLVKSTVEVESRVPIADTIIVGPVPNFLLGEFGIVTKPSM